MSFLKKVQCNNGSSNWCFTFFVSEAEGCSRSTSIGAGARMTNNATGRERQGLRVNTEEARGGSNRSNFGPKSTKNQHFLGQSD